MLGVLMRGNRRDSNRILEDTRLSRVIIWLAWPMILSASLDTLYQLIDTVWLGHVSPGALAAPALTWPVLMLLSSIGMGLSASVSALVGQYAGAGMKQEACRSFSMILGLYLLLAIPLLVLAEVLAGVYVSALGAPEEIAPLTEAYLRLIILSSAPASMFLLFSSALQALGDTMTPMKVSVAATILNAVLDPILIFPPVNLGVVGAALATLAASLLTVGFSAYSLWTGRHGIRVSIEDLKAWRRDASLVLRISSPMALQNILVSTGFAVMASIAARLGTIVAAAYSIGRAVVGLSHMLSMPISRATGIIVAQNLGAGSKERSRKAALTGLLLLVIASTLMATIILVTAPWFIMLFTSEKAVQEEAMIMLWYLAPSIVFFSILFLGNSIARSSGHTLLMSVLGASRLWVLRIPMCYLLAMMMGWGDRGLWLGMALSNYIAGTIALAWILSGRWLKPVIKKGGQGAGGPEPRILGR